MLDTHTANAPQKRAFKSTEVNCAQKENIPTSLTKRRCVSFQSQVHFTEVPSKGMYPVVCAMLDLQNGRTEAFTRQDFNHHINIVRAWFKQPEKKQKELLRACPPNMGVRLHVLLFCGAAGYGMTEKLLGVEHGAMYTSVIAKYGLAADMLHWKFCTKPDIFDRVHRKIASMYVRV